MGVISEKAVRGELGRRHFWDFVEWTFGVGYVGDAFHRQLAGRLEWFEGEVRGGRGPRLMVFAPPQHGKSELVSRRFPAWVLGRNNDWRVILASYGAELAEELSGDARDILGSDAGWRSFGVEVDAARRSAAAWRVKGHRGGMAAVGVGGAITGRAADILIVDDPVKGRREADSELYREESWRWWPQARDRVQAGGGILVMSTRWHHDDLAGRLLKLAREDPKADQWEVLSYTALAEEGDILGRQVGEVLAPGRFGLGELERIRAVVGWREWAAKYQQRPIIDEGAIFKREWWKFETLGGEVPRPVYQFWDTAFSRHRGADWSVCTTWAVDRWCYRLVDLFRARLDYPGLKREARRLYERWRPRAVVVEDIGSGKVLLQEFRRETRMPVLGYRPDRDKVARAHAVTPLIEAGKVVLPTGAAWLEGLLGETGAFPVGDHDDQVDSITMALICMGVRGIPVRGAAVLRDFRVVA